MKIKAGLLTLSAGLYSGVLAVDDEGEAVFTEDRRVSQEAEMSGTVTMGDLVDAGHLAEFRTPVLAKDNPEYQRLTGLIREGEAARVEGKGCPYNGQSVEHALHATGWVTKDLQLALDAVQAELEGVRQSNALLRENSERMRRNAELLVEQRDRARSAIDYIYGENSGQTDWQRIVNEKLTPPVPLEVHMKAQGLVTKHVYDDLSSTSEAHSEAADTYLRQREEARELAARYKGERDRARETNTSYAYQLKQAQNESEMLYNAVTVSQRWVEYHSVAQGIAAKALTDISAILMGEALPKQTPPPHTPPYAMPKHMQPVPMPLVAHPTPPQAPAPSASLPGLGNRAWGN